MVFSAGLWGMYQPLLRADFRLFDEYQMGPDEAQQGGEGAGGAPLLDCPLTTFYGSRDRRVKEHMVQVRATCLLGGSRGACSSSCLLAPRARSWWCAAAIRWLG